MPEIENIEEENYSQSPLDKNQIKTLVQLCSVGNMSGVLVPSQKTKSTTQYASTPYYKIHATYLRQYPEKQNALHDFSNVIN